MTIAIDRETGAVLGQTCESAVPIYVDGKRAVRVFGQGGYVTVPASTVRLEVVR